MSFCLLLTVHMYRSDEPAEAPDPEFAQLEAQAGLLTASAPPNESLQTFVYSATLSKDLQKNLSRRNKPTFGKKRAFKVGTTLGKQTQTTKCEGRALMRDHAQMIY